MGFFFFFTCFVENKMYEASLELHDGYFNVKF